MKRVLTTLKDKWPEYLIESIVIVGSILGAIGLENLNDSRRTSIERQDLISDLIEDFEYNHLILADDKINWSESKIKTMDLFFELINNDQKTVQMDSLKDMARVFFRFDTFSPNLTAYHRAQSTGAIALLDNNSLLGQFTLFTESYSTHQMVNQWSGEAFFQGPLWELRKTVPPGTIYNSIYPYTNGEKITFKEYQSLMGTPLALNALRNAYVLEQNSLENLIEMKGYTSNILNLLKGMKD